MANCEVRDTIWVISDCRYSFNYIKDCFSNDLGLIDGFNIWVQRKEINKTCGNANDDNENSPTVEILSLSNVVVLFVNIDTTDPESIGVEADQKEPDKSNNKCNQQVC